MKEPRVYCPKCSSKISNILLEGRQRDHCTNCRTTFYDNPLPVASSVVVNDKREILLVLRKNEPRAGMWGLPSGFAETHETVEEAALRELKEEAGITGRVVRLLDTKSHYNDFYGDLIWVTFEVKHLTGEPIAGDDAAEVKFFPLSNLPEIAFSPNYRAIHRYINRHRDLWSMQDSFHRLEGGSRQPKGEMPSDSLFQIISKDADTITENWIADVQSRSSTSHYATKPHDEVYQKAHIVISQFGKWMIHPEQKMDDIWEYFNKIGGERKNEKYRLSEVISALSLTRKHIFAHVFAQGGIWEKPLEMYRSMEFVSRVNLFFDRATYYITKGFEEHQ